VLYFWTVYYDVYTLGARRLYEGTHVYDILVTHHLYIEHDEWNNWSISVAITLNRSGT
jgi:hypothetical protein